MGSGLAVVAICLATACTTSRSAPAPASPAPQPSISSSTVDPSPSPSSTLSPSLGEPPGWLDEWELGARTLALRPDGYGEVRRTPRELRIRRLPTFDVLRPPASAEFTSSIARITPRVRSQMGTSWKRGCPVRLRGLRYVRVVFHGFDGRPHTGELIVHADHAAGVVGVFRKLYAARFPIEQMTLPTSAEPDPTPSGDGNGTGAMVCRPTTGATTWSAHAFGLALDLNPFQNPYQKDDLVLPELASAYLDRAWRRPGMIHPGGVVVRAFAEIGWSWGGNFQTLHDYHHFSATGR